MGLYFQVLSKEKICWIQNKSRCLTFLCQIVHTVGYSSSLAPRVQGRKSGKIIHKKVIWGKKKKFKQMYN